MGITRHPLFPDFERHADIPLDGTLGAGLHASFERISREDGRFAQRFYTRLFEREPALRALFPTDMASQEKKIRDTLAFIVSHLDEPALVGRELRDLGATHGAIGARAEHYPLVCATMLAAMGEIEGEAWTAALEADWNSALQLVSIHMLAGSRVER